MDLPWKAVLMKNAFSAPSEQRKQFYAIKKSEE